jgi:ferric-dicitrate binding protein FerR (iron transport regulator)
MDKEELLKKWLSDDLTDIELKEFKKLDDYNLNTEIIESAQYFKASHFSTVKGYDNLKSKLKPKNTPVIKLQSYKVLFRIAALFVISLGVYFTFFFTSITTVQTLASQKSTFELPDASTVTLNALSSISYNKKKWSDKRELVLDGEAFFKVAKGSKFDVKTSSGIVSVLGTQFTVKQRVNYFEVKCFEGIVSVSNNNKIHKLTKGKTYSIYNGIAVIDSTNSSQPKWINNISSFKSIPLYEVLNELERQYNIKINTQEVDTKRLFTGGFVHTNIDEALTAITVPLDLTYKKLDAHQILIKK